MEDVMAQLLRQHASLAGMLRRTMGGLSDEAFVRAPGLTAPPVGWHLWHVVRWADRFQATLRSDVSPREIWHVEGLAEACGLNAEDLGVLELGMAMDATKAQALPGAIGQARFEPYMEQVLDGLEGTLKAVDASTLLAPRMSIREYANVNGTIQYAPAQESTLLADILFHLTHSSRHMGSIEALRGL